VVGICVENRWISISGTVRAVRLRARWRMWLRDCWKWKEPRIESFICKGGSVRWCGCVKIGVSIGACGRHVVVRR